MNNAYIIDTVDSISIKNPTNISVTHRKECIDDKLYESDIKIMTTEEVIIKGMTIDHEYFLIKFKPDPKAQSKMYTGLEALREGEYELGE